MSDRGVGLATLALGVFVLVLTLQLPSAMLGDPMGPRLLPLVLGSALVLLGGALAASAGRAPAARAAAGSRVTGRLALVVVFTALYPAILTPLGYLLATGLILFALLSVYHPGRWVANLAIAAGFSLGCYLLFHTFLGVYVPPGFLV
jgi:putative tricarboxylic transport membrane protein